MFRKKPRWSRHNSTSSDFWLLLQLLLFASPPPCFCQTCFLVPFICPSHIPLVLYRMCELGHSSPWGCSAWCYPGSGT